MKFLKVTTLILLLFSCGSPDTKTPHITSEKSVNSNDDKEQIKNLVKQVYKWQDAEKINEGFYPLEKDGIYIGLDLNKHKLRLKELAETNYFSDEFLSNYQKIALTIDKKSRSKELEWLAGDIPPFGSDSNPWCNCQDYPYDNPWDKIEFHFLSLDNKNATLTWTWGHSEWSKNFNYKIIASKTNGNWRISYLQGFDFSGFAVKNF
jgi:hypothetical protein